MDRGELGYVYIAVHCRMAGMVKIGFSQNLKNRLSALNTALPEDFELKAVYETISFHNLESELKSQLADFQFGSKPSKEFYACSVEQAVSMVVKIAEENRFNGRLLSEDEIREMILTKS